MPAPMYYQLLGHVLVASHTAHDYKDIADDLSKAGFGESKVNAGLELAKAAEALVEKKLHQSPDDKNLEHSIHAAATEVEMWMQTVKFRARKGGLDAELVDDIQGHEIHGDKHTATVVAQASRVIGMLRTLGEESRDKIGPMQSVHDMLIRGNTLQKKLCKTAGYMMRPSSMAPASMPIFGEIRALETKMSQWLDGLDQAAHKVEDLDTLGMLGFVPHGMGMPVGGASFDVLRHERAKTTAPSAAEAVTTSGWSVGRQGNKENIGDGWIEPTYDVNHK